MHSDVCADCWKAIISRVTKHQLTWMIFGLLRLAQQMMVPQMPMVKSNSRATIMQLPKWIKTNFSKWIYLKTENAFKYIRVSHKTNVDVILQLLDKWDLYEPDLIISVTGGAQKFALKPRLRDVFRKGLVKAAASTSNFKERIFLLLFC